MLKRKRYMVNFEEEVKIIEIETTQVEELLECDESDGEFKELSESDESDTDTELKEVLEQDEFEPSDTFTATRELLYNFFACGIAFSNSSFILGAFFFAVGFIYFLSNPNTISVAPTNPDNLYGTNAEDFLHKRCYECTFDKPLTDYHRRSSRKDGRTTTCKVCVAKKQKNNPPSNKPKKTSTQPKKCTKCKFVLPAAKFSVNYRTSTGLTSKCTSCLSEHQNAASEWRIQKRKAGSCAICGYKDYRALQFAHLNRKDKYVSKKTGRAVSMCDMKSLKLLEAEFLKCRILCSNCHRAETNVEHQALRVQNAHTLSKGGIRNRTMLNARYKIVNDEKIKRKECRICNLKVTETTCCIFDFDHINPLTKIKPVCTLAHGLGNIQIIIAEMEKCDLLCSNCHIIKSSDKGESGACAFREITLMKRKAIDLAKRAGTYVPPPPKKLKVEKQ